MARRLARGFRAPPMIEYEVLPAQEQELVRLAARLGFTRLAAGAPLLATPTRTPQWHKKSYRGGKGQDKGHARHTRGGEHGRRTEEEQNENGNGDGVISPQRNGEASDDEDDFSEAPTPVSSPLRSFKKPTSRRNLGKEREEELQGTPETQEDEKEEEAEMEEEEHGKAGGSAYAGPAPDDHGLQAASSGSPAEEEEEEEEEEEGEGDDDMRGMSPPQGSPPHEAAKDAGAGGEAEVLSEEEENNYRDEVQRMDAEEEGGEKEEDVVTWTTTSTSSGAAAVQKRIGEEDEKPAQGISVSPGTASSGSRGEKRNAPTGVEGSEVRLPVSAADIAQRARETARMDQPPSDHMPACWPSPARKAALAAAARMAAAIRKNVSLSGKGSTALLEQAHDGRGTPAAPNDILPQAKSPAAPSTTNGTAAHADANLTTGSVETHVALAVGAKVAASDDVQLNAEPAATAAQDATAALRAEKAENRRAPHKAAVEPAPEPGLYKGAQATSETSDPSREDADDEDMDAPPPAAPPSNADEKAVEKTGARADSSQEIATQSEVEAATASEDIAEAAAASQSLAASVAEADGDGGALSPADAAVQNEEDEAVDSDAAATALAAAGDAAVQNEEDEAVDSDAAATALAAAGDNTEVMPHSPSSPHAQAGDDATELPEASAPDEHLAVLPDALIAEEHEGAASHTSKNKPADGGVKPPNDSSKKDKITKSAKGAPPAEASGKSSVGIQRPAAKKTKATRILPNFDAYKPYGATDSRKRSARDTPSPDPPAKPAAKKTALICISSDESEDEADDDDIVELAEPTVLPEDTRLENILRRPPPPPGHDFHPFASSLALVRAAWLSGLE